MTGDYALGSTIDFKFTARDIFSGEPVNLAGAAVAAYPDNSTSEITAGVTLTGGPFDGLTGLYNIRVVATSGNGFAAGSNYALVLTAGTADGVDVAGEVVGEFSIEAQSPLRPTTAGRTLDVTATGAAGVDWGNVENPTTANNLSGTSTKALEPTTAGRTLDVTATGAAGIDWGNVENPTTVVGLTNTTIKDATDVSLGIVAVLNAIAALNNLSSAEVAALLTATIADSIPADGTRPSIASGILMMTRFLMEKSLSGLVLTAFKEDGTTPSMTFDLDSATAPTSITRTS